MARKLKRKTASGGEVTTTNTSSSPMANTQKIAVKRTGKPAAKKATLATTSQEPKAATKKVAAKKAATKPAASKSAVERDTLGSRKGSMANAINEVLLAAKKPLSYKDVAEKAGVPVPRVRAHCKWLLQYGSIKGSEDGVKLISRERVFSISVAGPKAPAKKAAVKKPATADDLL